MDKNWEDSILEIPESNANLSYIEYYEKNASEYDVILRFTEEVQW